MLKTKRRFLMKNRYLYIIQIGAVQEIARFYEECFLLHEQPGFEYITSGPNHAIHIDDVSKIEEIPADQQKFYEDLVAI